MSMSNAQVALIAATNHLAGGDLQDVYAMADSMRGYLDKVDGMRAYLNLEPRKIREQCHSISRGNSRCDGDTPHAGRHWNNRHGTSWDDDDAKKEPATVQAPAARRKPEVHFTPSPGARHTACGRRLDELAEGAQVSLKVGNTTCPDCKEELGL